MEGLWNKCQSPSHAATTSSRPAVNLRIFERDLGLGVNRDGQREEPAGKSSRAPGEHSVQLAARACPPGFRE